MPVIKTIIYRLALFGYVVCALVSMPLAAPYAALSGYLWRDYWSDVKEAVFSLSSWTGLAKELFGAHLRTFRS